MGAGALAVSLALVALRSEAVNTRAAYRAYHAAVRLTAGTGTPALGPAPLRLRHLPVVTVSVGAQAAGIAVPRSFFGLSTEYWGLPRYERHMRLFERILHDVQVVGGGPTVIRVGGDSADHSYWEAIDRVMPTRAFELTQAWLTRTRTLTRSAHLKLILDLNLVADSTAMAVKWASAATTALPRGTITGFEVGNEPDLYHRSRWYRLAWIQRNGIARALALPRYSPASYVSGFDSYARALAAVARGVPILGPAVANPSRDVDWVASLLAHQPRAVGMVTAHRYPLSQCALPSSPRRPTIARVLSERSSAGMARSVAAAVLLTHRAGLKFRLTELNSVTCGGTSGVSDTFASALWAPDALFELLRNRVDGVNVHIRDDSINAPFILSGDGIRVRPLLYGMIMFARTLGPGARLLPTQTAQRHGLHLKAWAVQLAGHTKRVLLINKGRRSVSVVLRLPAGHPATVERLVAPSVTARSDVRLAGQYLNDNAVWQNPRTVERLAAGPRGYRVTMPGASAALISVPPARARSHHR